MEGGGTIVNVVVVTPRPTAVQLVGKPQDHAAGAAAALIVVTRIGVGSMLCLRADIGLFGATKRK